MIRLVLPLVNFENLVFDVSIFNYQNLIIFGILVFLSIFVKKGSPIKLILIAAILGIIIYSIS